MMASRVLFGALLAFASSVGINAQQYCGGGGYDVSVTARDLSLTANGYTWWIHPCGTVSGASDPQCALPSEAPYGAMFCQRGTTPLDTYVLASYNDTVARYQTKWYALPRGGVQMEVSNGDVCGSRFRTTQIEFQCDAVAVQPRFVSATEPETCVYKAVIATSSACNPVGNTISNVPGSSFYSTTCGGTFFDFTSLRNRDMAYDAEGHNYWLRLCESVQSPNCTTSQPTSFCQQRDNAAVTYDLSDWNATTPALYTITNTGVDIMIREGDMCGDQPRRATYSLQCNSRARTPFISYIQEYQTCHYKAVIQTSAVCTGTNNPARGYCGGAGYDLSGLQQADMTWKNAEYEFDLHPCGLLSPWYTGNCRDKDSMFCQTPIGSADGWSLATWNRTVSASMSTWIAIENGVQLYVSNSGESCGGVIRDTTINFICNRTAVNPWFAKVTEPSVCWYVAEVHTEHACDSVGSTAENVPGASFWSNECGGGIYDLSQIRAEEGELTWDSDASSPILGHKFYLEICGQVANPACASVQPTMLCQIGKNNSDAYSLSGHRAGAVQKYTINENGITMAVQDGTPCGAFGNRTTDIQIVCDGAQPAYISSLREIETCHYVTVVHGRCRRGVTPATDDTSSSSKLSGGAIAGIVIGSIVGALILLAILFFVCCGSGMSMRSKKGGRRFDEEESRNHESEMEMEGSTA